MLFNIEALLSLTVKAGEAILAIYNNPEMAGEISFKTDNSPLTLADSAANAIIVKGLKELTPNIPIISEEGKDVPYEVRKKWSTYWCVDPLDGTKEFIKKNGEFTVNIALISNNAPVLGIVYVPVTDVLYYGSDEIGSWKKEGQSQAIQLKIPVPPVEWISVGSRSHTSPEEAEVLSKYPVATSISVGSSLKFCMLAEGKAHIYYRHGPTMEWDTAAGNAIVLFSGGQVTQPDGAPFLYNKPSLLNGSFLCTINAHQLPNA